MLKYQLNTQTFDNDVVYLNYNSVDLTTYDEDPDNLMWVTLSCYDTGEIVHGDTLSITSNFIYFNDITQTDGNATDACNIPVEIVDLVGGTVTFIDKTYKELFPDTIVAKSDVGGVKWIISFPDTHYFNEFDTINLKFYYTDTDYIKINGLEYINFNTLSWDYDPEVAEELSTLIFGTSRPEPSDTIEGNPDKIVVRRDQVRWNRLDQNLPTVKVNKIKVRLNIPITLKSKTDLYKEGNINEYFVQHEKENSINTSIEMEKYPYTPVVVKINNSNISFEDCIKINFNLHFRVHDGNDWTVNDSDSWNFDKYGNHNDPTDNTYYSYLQNASSVPVDQWKRSCQSDLLGYADFTTNDVKYQKNKLKKSFIRLSFYDSNDPGKQSLLAYSTIFVDCNKLYSKFISRMNFNCYFESDGDIVKGIKTNREVNTTMGSDSLSSILRKEVLTTDEIEDSRLSTQISVKNKFLSNSSSEGFYLYTWELNDDPNTPSDVYMKVEFNHAGYGRTIPMMAPYITKAEHDDQSQGNPYYNKTGFKTNAEIVSDWSGNNRGYGIKRYTRYSYIHLKAKYDVNTKRHIYYLDPDTYGTKYDWDKNVLNINLYEARITFN